MSTTIDVPVPGELSQSLGRAAAIAELEAVLTAATNAHGGLVLITGEAGIGKTKLAAEAADLAPGLGISMHWSACWAEAASPPYWPWAQLVEGYLAGVSAAELPELLDILGPALASVAPTIAARNGNVPPTAPPSTPIPTTPIPTTSMPPTPIPPTPMPPTPMPPTPMPPAAAPRVGVPTMPTDDRFEFFQAIARFWTAAARSGPLLLIIDDLQRADPASIHLLAHVTTRLLHEPVALVVTFRTSEPGGEGMADALAELDRCAPTMLTLVGLPVTDLTALVEAADIRPDPAMVAMLAERSGGNPYFATELLRMLQRRPDGTISIDALATGVPRHLARSISRRLALLDAPLNELLQAAAVLGPGGDIDALAIASTLDPDLTWELLERATDLGLIVHDGPHRWRFAHTLVRDVLYRSLHLSTRRRLQERTLGAAALVTRGVAGVTTSGRLAEQVVDDSGVFRREGALWELAYAGLAIRMPHAKGLTDLAHLLSQPGDPMHVSELISLETPGAVVQSGSDEVFDARARQEFRQRLADLALEADEAEAEFDLGRAERARSDRAELVAALSSAMGLGGRARRLDDPLERARKTVSARIRKSIQRIEVYHSLMARHLERSVDTGLWCVYQPEQPTTWRT